MCQMPRFPFMQLSDVTLCIDREIQNAAYLKSPKIKWRFLYFWGSFADSLLWKQILLNEIIYCMCSGNLGKVVQINILQERIYIPVVRHKNISHSFLSLSTFNKLLRGLISLFYAQIDFGEKLKLSRYRKKVVLVYICLLYFIHMSS